MQELVPYSRLRELDRCLDALEQARLDDETVVDDELSARLRGQVPGIVPGLLITEALDLVFAAQERYLAGPPQSAASRGGGARVAVAGGHVLCPLDPIEARALTDSIRSATRSMCLLVLEAHERRAWCALGYHSWEQYVRTEFMLSKTRSYELLDQGRVIRELRAAAGVLGVPDISAYAAEQVKRHLEDMKATVRERVAGACEERAMAIIEEVVSTQRTRLQLRAAPAGRTAADPRLPQLRTAVSLLAEVPLHGPETAKIMLDGSLPLETIESALRWLNQVVSARRALPIAG